MITVVNNLIKNNLKELCRTQQNVFLLTNTFSNQIEADVFGWETPTRKWDPNWDKLAPASGQPASTATRHIFLIRHGEYNSRAETEMQKGLTNIGEMQANTTGAYLALLGHAYSDITFSDLTRSVESARIIGNSLPRTVERIRSAFMRECQPIVTDPIHALFYRKVMRHHSYEKQPLTEAGFRKVFHRAPPNQKGDSYHLVVGHLNVFNYFVCRALQVSPRAWIRFQMRHGSITKFSIKPDGRVILEYFADAGHLDKEVMKF